MTTDERYMYRCLQLARMSNGYAAPNPMVGAVIVAQGRVIGEGYHPRCGEPHAEVFAFRSVKEEHLLPEATLYVSLEPCAHYGKTPPCADLIVSKGIKKVVVGCKDPFSLVAGKGIARIREAGIEVVVGILEKECLELIRPFVVFHQEKRPYITLKWAESSNHCIAQGGETPAPVPLSTPITSVYVHKQRALHSAILIGTQTALIDNPQLNVRHWTGKQPLRIVIDLNGTLPTHLHLWDGTQPMLVVTHKQDLQHPHTTTLFIPQGEQVLPALLQYLHEQNIQSLLVEGGSTTHQYFLDQDLWDEIFVEHSPLYIADGIKSPTPPIVSTLTHIRRGEHIVSHYIK